ncbi:MAG: YSC84-related protein [Geminicoccaceae bacterium]
MPFLRSALLVCLMIGPLALAGCASGSNPFAGQPDNVKAANIDAEVDAALAQLFNEVPAAQSIADQAEGVLIFPSVVKGSFIFGAEYGEGALRVNGQTVNYYNTAGGSVGFQAGAQSRSEAIFFLSQEALDSFRSSQGFEAGVDGTITVLDRGAAAKADTTNINNPIVAFIYGAQGLMAGVSLEGAKFTKLDIEA